MYNSDTSLTGSEISLESLDSNQSLYHSVVEPAIRDIAPLNSFSMLPDSHEQVEYDSLNHPLNIFIEKLIDFLNDDSDKKNTSYIYQTTDGLIETIINKIKQNLEELKLDLKTEKNRIIASIRKNFDNIKDLLSIKRRESISSESTAVNSANTTPRPSEFEYNIIDEEQLNELDKEYDDNKIDSLEYNQDIQSLEIHVLQLNYNLNDIIIKNIFFKIFDKMKENNEIDIDKYKELKIKILEHIADVKMKILAIDSGDKFEKIKSIISEAFFKIYTENNEEINE
jgi:hypothetical protein